MFPLCLADCSSFLQPLLWQAVSREKRFPFPSKFPTAVLLESFPLPQNVVKSFKECRVLKIYHKNRRWVMTVSHHLCFFFPIYVHSHCKWNQSHANRMAGDSLPWLARSKIPALSSVLGFWSTQTLWSMFLSLHRANKVETATAVRTALVILMFQLEELESQRLHACPV